MNDGFLIIAITSPHAILGEAEKICSILQNKRADIIHIRKPHWTEAKTAELLQQIPSGFYHQIKLHDHYSLLERFPLLGVHLNSRNVTAPDNVFSVSRSFHTLDQLHLSKEYDYVTLSPIFDSISKTSYKSSFSLSELKPIIKEKRVIALGGVTPDKIPELKETGFYGAAMLGYFWS